jgi:hypothetical protein
MILSSNSKEKSKPIIHIEGCDIMNKVMQVFYQEKSHGNLKFPIENATKHAAAAMGKSEASVYKIRKEANMASISGEKLKSFGKTHKPSFKRIQFNDLDFCVIRRQFTIFTL